MLIWDDSRTTLRKFCQDNSPAGVEFQDLMANVGYKKVLTELGRQVTENTRVTTLEASTREYQVAPDCVWPKTIWVVDGTTKYELTEEASDRKWAMKTSTQFSGIPREFHYYPRFGIGGGVLELNPIPSSAYIMKMIYEATEKDLSQVKYTTGSISLVSRSATVTGTGTNFQADMVNRYLRLNGTAGERLWYRIKEYLSGTELELEQFYHGNDVTQEPFIIAEAFALPEDCQMLPLYFAAWEWWLTKGNKGKIAEFEKKYISGMQLAKRTHATTTRNNIINQDVPAFPFGEVYPAHYPLAVES